ncbi:MAG TPA: PHP-associated domain-containing protein [Thermomicrobiaceae bacterium]|nr:PHP-associated domain-containing protein [Thermomicrobiaceae bacterium]
MPPRPARPPERDERVRRATPVDRGIVGLLRALSFVAYWIPWPVWHLLAFLAGVAGMALGFRRVVLDNVRHVRHPNPPSGIVAWYLGVQAIASHCKTVVSLLRAGRGDSVSPDRLEIRGLSNLEANLGKRGTVVVAPHAGPYPTLGLMAARWLRDRGFDGELAVVVRLFEPLKSPALMQWFTTRFSEFGVTVVSAGEPPARMARTLLSVLRKGGIVILFVDEPGPNPSIAVPFFDSAMQMPIGPVRLARATGSVILPCMATYGPSRTSELTVMPPIEPAESALETLSAIATALEGLIHRHLDQWSMLTPIWQEAEASATVPAGHSYADLHLHTPGSDGLCSVADWLVSASESDVAVIGVTDHDHIDTVRSFVQEVKGGTSRLIPGVEVTARGRIVHLGVLFPDVLPSALPKPGTPLLEVVRWARAIPGSVVVLVHPLPLLWRIQLRRLERAGLLPDAMETSFPLVFGRGPALEHAARRYGLASLGGTDAHLAPGQLGRHVTCFPGETPDDLVAAIRARRTVAMTRPPRIDRLPLQLYALQCAYSWLYPFRGVPSVARVRSGLLTLARDRSRSVSRGPVPLQRVSNDEPSVEAAANDR